MAKHIEIDERCPTAVAEMLVSIAEQCGKEQYFNALHRLSDLQHEIAVRLQAAVNGRHEEAMSPARAYPRTGMVPA